VLGLSPTKRRNCVLNEPRLENPTAKHTSVTDRSPARSNAMARSMRRLMRYWCGVSPNADLKLRLK
jgi:hypothetical protein